MKSHFFLLQLSPSTAFTDFAVLFFALAHCSSFPGRHAINSGLKDLPECSKDPSEIVFLHGKKQDRQVFGTISPTQIVLCNGCFIVSPYRYSTMYILSEPCQRSCPYILFSPRSVVPVHGISFSKLLVACLVRCSYLINNFPVMQ